MCLQGQQVADMFTKGLPKAKYVEFTAGLGLRPDAVDTQCV